jgi:hypothetical protein
VQADALQIMDRFEAGTFDYAHAGMFLHHLDDLEVMTALRIMHRLAGRGLIWNDLVRGTVELLLVRSPASPPGSPGTRRSIWPGGWACRTSPIGVISSAGSR